MRRVWTAILLLLSATDAFARAGGGGGYSGGGGSHGGGYGGGSGRGGGGAGVIFFFVELYFRLLLEHPFIMIPLTLLAIWAYTQMKPTPNPRPLSTIEALATKEGEAFVEQMPPERGAALNALRVRDPGYSEEVFLERASGAFLAIQDAWSNQDMTKARAFISDGVHERFTRQIAEQKARGVRNRMTGVDVTARAAYGYRTGPHFDAVFVRFRAAALDEVVNVADGRVLESDSGEFEEIWTFVRRPGAKTLSRPGPIEGHCPSCGAPLQIADAAQCAACKAWVNSGEYDWILTTITQASEWEFPDVERDVFGWKEMRAKDADLSLESLEDRASVVFWRWMDALRRQDLTPLRGVSAEEALKTLKFDGSFAQDGAVGLVQTMGFELGQDFDLAHVQVRWEAEQFTTEPGSKPASSGREKRTDFLIFRRKAGASSDPKAGLSTSRCPSCGAPPAEPDAAACSYCGRAFNDGSRQWVLWEIVPFGIWHRPEPPGA